MYFLLDSFTKTHHHSISFFFVVLKKLVFCLVNKVQTSLKSKKQKIEPHDETSIV